MLKLIRILIRLVRIQTEFIKKRNFTIVQKFAYFYSNVLVFRMYSESFFWKLGHKFTDHRLHLSPTQGHRRFKTFYGVSPNICSILWGLIEQNVPETCEPKHLLWGLCFLKQYNNESVNRATFGTDEKTFRKYVWILIDLLAHIDVVRICIFVVLCEH